MGPRGRGSRGRGRVGEELISPRLTGRCEGSGAWYSCARTTAANARVAKSADAADLGSAAARRKGSTPFPCTCEDLHGLGAVHESGKCAPIRTSVRTPLDEATLEAAIARLTRALATADDETIPDLVMERAALRRELAELRQGGDVVRVDDEPARRERGR